MVFRSLSGLYGRFLSELYQAKYTINQLQADMDRLK